MAPVGAAITFGYQIRNLEDGSTRLPAECDVLCVPAAKPA
jgi:hypothetical protein